MTNKEVFLKFCKLNKMMPYLVKKFYDTKIEDFIYNKDLNAYVNRRLTFDEHFNRCVRYNGLNGLYFEVFARLTNYGYNGTEEYRKSLKRWSYFVRNNVFLKDNVLNVGDEIEIRTFPGDTLKLTVTHVSVPYSSVSAKNERCNKTIYFSDILTVNGKKFEPDYYLKIKRKTYGID